MLKGILITGGLIASLLASSSDNRREALPGRCEPVVSKRGKLSFSVPTKPRTRDNTTDGIPSSIFESVTGLSRYLIVVGELSPWQQAAIKDKEGGPGLYSKRYMLDCLVDGFLRGAKGKTEDDAYFSFQGMPARRATVIKDFERIRVFGVMAKTHMYIFSAGYMKGYPYQKEYSRFYDSIRITR